VSLLSLKGPEHCKRLNPLGQTHRHGQIPSFWQEYQVRALLESDMAGGRTSTAAWNLANRPPYSASFSPFAARTQQFVKEQLGQADEKVHNALPAIIALQL
jgi:hypothetical protein